MLASCALFAGCHVCMYASHAYFAASLLFGLTA
jgi:hypothetical protein